MGQSTEMGTCSALSLCKFISGRNSIRKFYRTGRFKYVHGSQVVAMPIWEFGGALSLESRICRILLIDPSVFLRFPMEMAR